MTDEPNTAAERHDADDSVMGLLADHVPITLLVDLAEAPESEALLRAEGLPAEAWWEHCGDGR